MEWVGNFRRGKLLHWAFELGIWFKGLDGALEVLGGILFLVTSPQMLNHFIVVLTQHELNEAPGDLVANALRHAGQHLSGKTKLIGGAYLLAHGAIKLFLAIGILRGKQWCYPVTMAVIGAFVLLQSSRMGLHFSLLMLFLTLLDIAIVLLIWREYRCLKHRRK
jgi:uncharacterized membrane protein